MIGSTPALHALGAGPVRAVAPAPAPAPAPTQVQLVSPDALHPSLAFARASAALFQGADGTWQATAADAPRFAGASRRLLVEGPRANGNRNPRGEGSTVGGTALPTYWSSTAAGGLTRTCVGQGTANGLPYIDLRFAGTAATTAGFLFDSAGLAAPAGQAVTASLVVAVVDGTLGGITAVNHRITVAGGTGTANQNLRAGLSATPQRFAVTTTAGAGATAATHAVVFSLTSGAAVDVTLRLAAPQIEFGAFATTPVLPAAGAPASAARAADLPTLALSAAAAAQGTLVGTFVLSQAAPAGAGQGLLSISDDTAGNRIGLHNAAGGLTIVPLRAASGTETAGGAAGTVVAGTPFRAALAWDAGGIAACVGGGAVQTLAGANPAVSRLLIGHGRVDLAAPLSGEVGPLVLHTTRLSDVALQASTAG